MANAFLLHDHGPVCQQGIQEVADYPLDPVPGPGFGHVSVQNYWQPSQAWVVCNKKMTPEKSEW